MKLFEMVVLGAWCVTGTNLDAFSKCDATGPGQAAVYACEYAVYDAPAHVVIVDVVVAVEVARAWALNAVVPKCPIGQTVFEIPSDHRVFVTVTRLVCCFLPTVYLCRPLSF